MSFSAFVITMAKQHIYCVYFSLLIFVWSHAARTVKGNNNVYTLVYGSEANLANLYKETKILREILTEHRQSLSNLQKNYASLQKRLDNLEITQKRQSNANIVQKLQKYIVSKLNEQSKELMQKQSNYKNTIQDIFETQMKTFKKELKNYKTKLLDQMQSELGKRKNYTQDSDEKHIDMKTHKTLIEFLTNLKNNSKEIKKLPPEAVTLFNDITNIIENPLSNEDDEDTWSWYAKYLPNAYDETVEVNAKPAVDVEIADSCHKAITSMQIEEATAGDIYALNMTKYNLTNMYGYCLPDPHGEEAWLVIERRISNASLFNRTWQEYKNGFGDLTDSFFIGLERLHKLLLGSNSQLWIQLGKESNESPHRIYTNFMISNETDQYRLTSLNLEDLRDDLVNAKGWSFQTFDVGNKCAEIMQSGWWYNETVEQNVCSNGNLNTKLENVSWNGHTDVVYMHMAIRHKDPPVKLHISFE
ncbi:angiopoietin-related protein 7 isoform X1 [Bactrocera oleae]|uniref:angiopoietin-related protein 7 isoform X1 n=2 Tax=Bactrocera oleae TaxID=104688 RepID=UPI00387E75D1